MPQPNDNHPPSHDARLDKIEAALARIEIAIIGDVVMGHVGLVHRISEHETRLAKIEADRASESSQRRGAIAVIAGASAVAGAIGGFVTWAIGVFGQNHHP